LLGNQQRRVALVRSLARRATMVEDSVTRALFGETSSAADVVAEVSTRQPPWWHWQSPRRLARRPVGRDHALLDALELAVELVGLQFHPLQDGLEFHRAHGASCWRASARYSAAVGRHDSLAAAANLKLYGKPADQCRSVEPCLDPPHHAALAVRSSAATPRLSLPALAP
jgi:hypothetical protein